MTAAADPQRDQRWAWGFVVLLVAGAVLGQLIGYGMAVLLGFPVPEEAEPSRGQALLIAAPALAVSIAPGIGAVVFGVRAGRSGRFSGYLAAGVGALAVAYWLVVAVASMASAS